MIRVIFPGKMFNSQLKALFFNHADAWFCTLAIAVGALILHQAMSGRTLLLAAGIAAGYWLAFALNDYYDAPYDALVPEKARRNYFVLRPIGRPAAIALFWGAALVISPIFIPYGPRGWFICSVAVAVMWAYSAPPLRLKVRPGIDLLAHAFFVQTFPYAAILFLIEAHWEPFDTGLIVLGLLASATAQLEQQIRDAEIDGRFEQTLTTRIGVERALRLLKLGTAFMICFGLAQVAVGSIPLAVAFLGLLTIPAVIPRFWRRANQPRPERLIRTLLVIGFLYLIGLISWTAAGGSVPGPG